ncbi:nitrate ABC transporter permease [Gordoniibacillus kamchatkensis]|uniref:Nitrate ABC transporter permease n=1 Tax=Gordoniibacillus kamchatkensis TaxID=1590651 RepID=A0ABR5AG41_9BACL|nr:ABC transporter permease [Paenibacillus sp. VKM B-2647]KIL39920.1 nitrate ABC transporter permease [Paenibacillus sp. VKM B-2647]
MKTGTSWWKRGWPPTAAVLLLLLAWQIGVQLSGIEKFKLPSPADIGREAVASFPRIWMHTEATLHISLIGFACGVAVGIGLALAMHMIAAVKSGLYPLLIISQNIHPAALGPLLMIWFGFLSPTPKIIVIALYCFFPVTVALTDALARTDRGMADYMRMIGASKAQLFRKLELPHALPSLFSGLKIAATYSIMGAVVAEFLGGDKGLGYYIQFSRNQFQTTRVFVALFVIIILAFIMFGIVALLEKMLIGWNQGRGE